MGDGLIPAACRSSGWFRVTSRDHHTLSPSRPATILSAGPPEKSCRTAARPPTCPPGPPTRRLVFVALPAVFAIGLPLYTLLLMPKVWHSSPSPGSSLALALPIWRPLGREKPPRPLCPPLPVRPTVSHPSHRFIAHAAREREKACSACAPFAPPAPFLRTGNSELPTPCVFKRHIACTITRSQQQIARQKPLHRVRTTSP